MSTHYSNKVHIISELHINYNNFYTSGKRDGSGGWIWLATGQPFGYTSWGTGEPNNFEGHIEDSCVFVNKEYKPMGDRLRTIHWNDVVSTLKRKFICEFH